MQVVDEDSVMNISHILIAAVLCGMTGLAMADDQGKITAPEFVKKAATDGLAEVEMGKLAQQQATDPQVKAFGKKLVADHSKANEELTSIASAKGLDVPKAPGMMQKATMEKFQHDKGKDFDKHFAQHMVKDHEEAISLFEKAANDPGMDPDLRAFAKKTLPTLREHLKAAQMLEGKLSA
jgi:putative membrane protein